MKRWCVVYSILQVFTALIFVSSAQGQTKNDLKMQGIKGSVQKPESGWIENFNNQQIYLTSEVQTFNQQGQDLALEAFQDLQGNHVQSQ